MTKHSGLILILLSLLLVGCDQRAAPLTAADVLRAEVVRRGNLEITVPASGNVAANEIASLSFAVPGKVAEVNVAMSDVVAQGDTLARLETDALEFAVRQAEIALAQTELRLDSLREPADEDALELARWRIQQAAQALEAARISKEAAALQGGISVRRALDVYESADEAYSNMLEMIAQYNLPDAHGAGAYVFYVEAEGNVGITQAKADLQIQQAQSQWLIAYNSYRQAIEDLDALEAPPDETRIRQTELQIEQARLNLEQARANQEQTTLTAPFAGVVAAVNIQTGALAATGLPAITLLDPAQYYVKVTVDEIDIGKIAVGQPARVTLDAYPDQVLDGVVDSITALPTSGAGLIAYPLRVRLTDTGEVAVRDGMTAGVVILIDTVEDVLLVPNWAIRLDQSAGSYFVYVQRGESVERADIRTGRRNDAFTEVLEGLEPGATVALVTGERTTNLFEFRGPPSRGQ